MKWMNKIAKWINVWSEWIKWMTEMNEKRFMKKWNDQIKMNEWYRWNEWMKWCNEMNEWKNDMN